MSDIYLVDDHVLLRDGLRAVLQMGGHRVVGESDDITHALSDLVRLSPGVLLLDLHLGERNGLELLERMQQRGLSTRTIVLTMVEQAGPVVQALRLGAMGYVLKGSAADEVLLAVDAVSQGRTYVTPAVQMLVDRAATRPDAVTAVQSLSARENQIVRMVVRGMSSAAIGAQLHLSPKTVETYRSRLMAKLGVGDLPALVRLAIREGLIGIDED
ncbi:MAG: response regulator transcription factor [Hydrogenophaga sp.]|nr:response regulator transcription factor [Hydrogenophaga sp.]